MTSDWLLNEENRADFETSGSKVTFKHQPDQSNYYNAMYLGLTANEKNKKYYWEFTCSGRCSVGVAKKEAFADGYKISGAFFNGNLTDGSCLLTGEFGDRISDGEKIVFILDLTEKELKIYIIQNGRPLGLAFVHSAPYSGHLHPTISFCSPGSVEVKEIQDKTGVESLLNRSDYIHRTIDGKYKLVQSIEKSSEKSLPNYELTIRGDSKNNDQIHLSIHVVNCVGGILKKTGSDEEGDLFEVEGLMSTMMAGDPIEMQNEFYLSSVIHNLKRLKFNDTLDEVTILSPDTTLHFKRFLPEKSPHKTSSLLK